ncbi:MAG: ribonuclease Y [Chloroflexi bacterium]|nr:ribonuclease Y [Chloroflexota bacterium]
MLTLVIGVLAVLVALGVGVVTGYVWRLSLLGKKLAEAEAKASQLLQKAEEQKKLLMLEAKEEALKTKAAADAELRERRSELQRQERRLGQRDENLERRAEALERRERGLVTKEREVEALRTEVEELKLKQVTQLETLAGLSVAEAKQELLRRAEADMQHELARRYWEMEQGFQEEGEQKARRILAMAVNRLAVDVVSESTVTVLPLPNDEMKGRLIGREGRNIRAIEQATGVDLIIDDTPEAVTISCFDPVRREIARLALQRLIQDGRIHPARVEETVERATAEVDKSIWEAGEQAIFDASVQGLHPELIKLVGRLKYRSSYGQNVWKHSLEVALLAGMMAAEVGCDIKITKTGGLLHDIGKALTHEVEGLHAQIGAEVAAKHGMPDTVCRCIAEHHDNEKSSIESFIVSAADAISAARPGARKDTLEHYVKRLEALETVAKSFSGVEKTFAIQAGREVRIMVKPDVIDDVAAANLARDVVKKIQEDLVYPGQIKVVVIRETRNVEYAR